MMFLFQNASEVSDEELNDDLLQSDEEDIGVRCLIYWFESDKIDKLKLRCLGHLL